MEYGLEVISNGNKFLEGPEEKFGCGFLEQWASYSN